MKRLHSFSVLTTKVLLVATVAFGFSACTKDLYDPSANGGNPSDGDNPFKIGEVTLDNYNDYATTKSVQLNIDYGTDCAGAHFEVYAENPFEVKENQVVRRKDLVAVASGFTGVDGKYNAKASITSSVSEVYICSFDFGVPTLSKKIAIDNNTITAKIAFENAFDLTSMVNNNTVTRAATNTITKNIPNTLGTWNSKGLPNYLDKNEKIKITDNLKKYITSYFEEGGNNANSFVTDDADIVVLEDANVWINYFGGTTGAQSVFAYYCYDKNATTTEILNASKKACVIFPSAHSSALGDYSGVAVKLMYIDKNGVVQTDKFPKDTKVGFLIWNNGWTNGNGGAFDNNVFYSTALLNRDKRSHTAVFSTKNEAIESERLNVITMEDWTDSDYNDVAFVIKSNPIDAIDVPAANKPGDRKGTDTYRGLLGFEDNWPNKGDYDMNDVIMKYVSNVDYNFSNNVIGITDKFTLSWTGADYKNGFAYEVPFDLSNDKIEVDVKGGENWSVDRTNNVITLFNDAKAELGVSGVKAKDMPNHTVKEISYTVTIQFKEDAISIPKDQIVSPYNPFIMIRKNNKNMEIHLTNFKPSKLAGNVFDQSSADISDGKKTFFVCKDGYPFAIHLDARVDASVMSINLKAEGEDNRIDKVYPSFAEWALTRNPSIQWWKK